MSSNNYLYFAVFLFGWLIFPSVSARHVQFYRKDYTYVKEFDAFYKVHWDLRGLSWNSAFITCDDEGATLFYPKLPGEWALVKNLTNNMTDPPNVTEIFVGFHDEFGLGEFVTVDGHSTPYPLLTDEQKISGPDNCILLDIETGLYTLSECQRQVDSVLPFVCKKSDDESCPTIDRGYKYSPVSKKCYKVNKKPMMWQEAMHTCYMEGGILVVLESRVQVNDIMGLVNSNTFYFVGVKKMFVNGEYYTVKGQKYSNVYQQPYSSNQDYDCGAIYVQDSIYTTTKDCFKRLPFICEMEVPQ